LRINREGWPLPTNSPDHPILPGDIITMDAGLAFDLYRSDYQRTAYVLRHGETGPPESLQQAFSNALRVRDQLTANMVPGEIAHKVWDKTMEWAQSEGYAIMYPAASGRRETVTQLQAGIYCHSIGNSTHDIGARIAVDWPTAYGDRVRYPLELNQWYSVELGVSTPIPEWGGRAVFVGIEEDAALTGQGVEFFAPPQTELIVIAP
jgi:Xaa-Pro aminopeptidase